MKKNIILTVFCLILSTISFAQVPQKMSYQAVVRGSDNNLVTNHQVAMRVSILQGSVDGTAVYTETHSATTNANGLLTIEIGDGTSNDNFTAINWANGPFFVKTETDVNGGDDYDIVGVSQLLSVPYAMYAQTAGNMPDVSGFLTVETDPTIPDWAKANAKPTYSYDEITGKPELFSGNYNDLTNKPTIPTVPTNVSEFTNDANYVINEADPTVPAWAKANAKPTYSYDEITGKPELFSGNYNDLTNKPTIPTVPTNVSAFTNDANYVVNETDPTIPDWAKANAKPTYSYDEITGKPTNVSAFTNDANYLTTEGDPTVPTWAKANTKPIYNYSEIQNAPANVSAFENDANYVINETDPTIPDWAKADTKPIYNYSEIQNAPANVSAFENDANYISAESQTIADVAALGNSLNTQLKNVTDPTDAQDAATKKYIDDIVAPILAQNARMQATVDSLNYVLSLNLHEYVDLGLPSGTKWATCNVGANSPEEYGDYFAWGETSTKTTYSSSAYTYSGNPTTLPSSADAATANWGSAWRMPTKEEFDELKNNCTVTWTTQNGVNGRLFTGPNGASIFLPAAGYRNVSGLNYAGSNGNYWLSSLDTGDPRYALYLYFYSGNCSVDYDYRYYGQSVRPVCAQ